MADCNALERRLLIRTGIQNGSSAVIVSVTDRGSSIPEKKMEEIFEPFFTTKEKGMGLGLSICRTIVTAHRGKLWATNNPDGGATFYFSLPVEVSPVAMALRRRAVESDTGGAPRHSEATTTFTAADSNKELIADT
jgi:nitrogen-specific signal transduction histidine kinase